MPLCSQSSEQCEPVCRQGWKALLADQGFESVVALGEATSAPALLQRQSVVAGVSNGEVLARTPATKPARLRATMQPLTATILNSFASIPLRTNMGAGRQAVLADLARQHLWNPASLSLSMVAQLLSRPPKMMCNCHSHPQAYLQRTCPAAQTCPAQGLQPEWKSLSVGLCCCSWTRCNAAAFCAQGARQPAWRSCRAGCQLDMPASWPRQSTC